MDCMVQTSFTGGQGLGTTFVYTKYFFKLREQQKRRRSISVNVCTDHNRRKTLSGPHLDDAASDQKEITSLYNYLVMLFTRAKQYAVINKCLCNALRSRPSEANRKKARDNRKKLSEILEQISTISFKIEKLPSQNNGVCQLILQRNVRLQAALFIEELSLRMSEDIERIAFVTGHSSLEECIENTHHYCGARSAICTLAQNVYFKCFVKDPMG